MEAKHGPIAILTLVSIFALARASSSSFPQLIQDSCNKTTYPSLCLKTLAPYAASSASTTASSYDLCDALLNEAIQAATNCSAEASKTYNVNRKSLEKAEASVVKDCISELKEAVYELKETVAAMKHLGGGGEDQAGQEFVWSNAKTYASAAITDAETCVDGFGERKVSSRVRKKMKGCVTQVEQLISNALSLINHLY